MQFKMFETSSKDSRYEQWAFRCAKYYIVAQIAIFYIVMNVGVYFCNAEKTGRTLEILSILSLLLIALGAGFTVNSYLKKERRTYKFYLSAIVFLYAIVIIILNIVFGTVLINPF